MPPKGKNNVTVREIARLAGVSVSTVSRVMSGPEKSAPISEETRKRVMQVCEELRFLPDVHYSRLQERRSYVVALMIPRTRPDSPMPLFSDENIGRFMSALEEELCARGYSILIQGVDEAYEKSGRSQTILRNNTADGLIVWDAFKNPATVRDLNDELRPTIYVAFPYEDAKNFIVPDNRRGAYDMTRHLLALGHRRIAYLSGGMGELVDVQREEGYRAAMTEAGCDQFVYDGHYTVRGGRRCAQQVFEEHPEATAIFAANDLMAIGALDAAREKGLRVPQDFSVAGFDGSSHAEYATPGLTTGRLPMAETGRLAAQNLVRIVETKDIDPVQMTLPIEIIARASTGPAPKKGTAAKPAKAKA